MTGFSDSRVHARLNPDGTFTLTAQPGAPRDAILGGLLAVPAGTALAGTPTRPHSPAVLLLVPPGVDGPPAVGGWVPRIPPADGAGLAAEADSVQAALTTLLAAAVLDLPGFARRSETRALHDALGRLLRSIGPDDPPWRVPRPR